MVYLLIELGGNKKNQLILIIFALFINSSLSFAQIKTEKFEIDSKEVKGVSKGLKFLYRK
jgi:hypothetical protein